MHLTTKELMLSSYSHITAIDMSAWIQDGNLASVITLQTGNCHLQAHLNSENAQNMIAMLEQHIANIKTVEMDLIARQSNPSPATHLHAVA